MDGTSIPCRQVHPLLSTIGQPWHAKPTKHARIIAAYLEHGVRGRLVQEVKPPGISLTPEQETPHPMPRKTRQVIAQPRERKAEQIDKPFVMPREMTIQAEKSAAVTAKRIQLERHGLTVRPKDFIPFEENSPTLKVA